MRLKIKVMINSMSNIDIQSDGNVYVYIKYKQYVGNLSKIGK